MDPKSQRAFSQFHNDGITFLSPPQNLSQLVGNKADLNDLRQVSVAAAMKLARENDMTYIETSAKVNVNIQEAFQQMVDKIVTSLPAQHSYLKERTKIKGTQAQAGILRREKYSLTTREQQQQRKQTGADVTQSTPTFHTKSKGASFRVDAVRPKKPKSECCFLF